MKIGYVGALLFPTGYGHAAREHIKALDKVGVSVVARLNQMPHVLLRRELINNDHRVNQLLEMRDEDTSDVDAWIAHLTPDVYGPMSAPVIGYAVWELVGLPGGWANSINTVCKAIFTSSEFSKNHFINGGVKVPIYVVPHPVDLDAYNPDAKPLPAIASITPRPRTIFLMSAQWMPRKGVEDVLIAYLTEFKNSDNVLLVAQVWRNNHSPSEQQAVTQMIGTIRQGLNIGDQPPIKLLGGRVNRNDMPGIYTACDVFVTASRGEAFCLPVFEAAASRRPTIATHWGGQWDYLDERSAFPVVYDMEPAHGVGGIWKHYNGSQWWARASVRSLREQMRLCHDNKDEVARRGAQAFEVVATKLTYPIVGEQMKAALEEIIARAAPPLGKTDNDILQLQETVSLETM